MLSEAQIERYARHVLLREVGGVGQERLLAGEVAIAPLPAAGAWAAAYLAAAGVGRLSLRDPAPVAEAELWPLLCATQLGSSRERSLAAALPGFNDEVQVTLGDGSATALRIDCGLPGAPIHGEAPRLLVHAAGEVAAVGWLGPGAPCGPCVREALGGDGPAAPWAAAAAGALAAGEALRRLAAIGSPLVGLAVLDEGRARSLELAGIDCAHRAGSAP